MVYRGVEARGDGWPLLLLWLAWRALQSYFAFLAVLAMADSTARIPAMPVEEAEPPA